MPNLIKTTLEEKFPIDITPAIANALCKYTLAFEVKNSKALSTPYLGLESCKFKEQFKQEFFDIFNTDGSQIAKLFNTYSRNTFAGVNLNSLTSLKRNVLAEEQKTYSDQGISNSTIKAVINTIDSIDKNFKVVSDPFNLFTSYVVYRCEKSKLPEDLKKRAQIAVLKLLQYKYFTSLVNYRFKYRPSEAAMQATFESLSDRFDIRKYGTWQKVMENRVIDILGPESIHRETIRTFADDKAVLYFITDFQTRIRNQLNIFCEEYMRVKELNNTIGSYSTTGSDAESGEKIILDNEDALTSAGLKIYSDSLITSKWLYDPAIRVTVSLFTALNITLFKKFLIGFSEYSVLKNNRGLKEEMKEENGIVMPIGPYSFITNAIQQSYRYCINNNVNTKNPVDVLKAVRGAMSSSRVSDPGIVAVRAASNHIVNEVYESNRDTTLSALRIGLIIYIVLLTIKETK